MKIYNFTNFLAFIIGNYKKRFLLIICILLCTKIIASTDSENSNDSLSGIYMTNNPRIYQELQLLPDGRCKIHACEKHESFCLKYGAKYAERNQYSGKWAKYGDTIFVKYELNDFIANAGLEAYKSQSDTIHRKLHLSERLKIMVDWTGIWHMLLSRVDVLVQTKYYIIDDTTLEEKCSDYPVLRFHKIKTFR